MVNSSDIEAFDPNAVAKMKLDISTQIKDINNNLKKIEEGYKKIGTDKDTSQSRSVT